MSSRFSHSRCALARALEFKDSRGALRLLREAVPHSAAVGPVLHARVLGMLAEHVHHTQGANETALELYDEAIGLLVPTELAELRAGMHLERGLVAHQLADTQRHRLVEASRSYQSALIVLSEERHPEQFALANMNNAIRDPGDADDAGLGPGAPRCGRAVVARWRCGCIAPRRTCTSGRARR